MNVLIWTSRSEVATTVFRSQGFRPLCFVNRVSASQKVSRRIRIAASSFQIAATIGKDQKGFHKRGIHDQGDFWELLLYTVKKSLKSGIWPFYGYPFCGYPFWSCSRIKINRQAEVVVGASLVVDRAGKKNLYTTTTGDILLENFAGPRKNFPGWWSIPNPMKIRGTISNTEFFLYGPYLGGSLQKFLLAMTVQRTGLSTRMPGKSGAT